MKKSLYPTIAPLLPAAWQKVLFGDRRAGERERERERDPDWLEWQRCYLTFYQNTQKAGIGQVVNNAGYNILGGYDFTGLRCLEIGPGILPHMRFWRGRPACYDIADIQKDLLDASRTILDRAGVPGMAMLLPERTQAGISAPDASYDCILSFYSLEHLSPLDAHLKEYHRLLRPGGMLVGAIPAEGGLAWGLGRMLTSRRYAKKHFSCDFDKITAWEHCNTAGGILHACDALFRQQLLEFWPLRVPLVDINLVIRFKYRKAA